MASLLCSHRCQGEFSLPPNQVHVSKKSPSKTRNWRQSRRHKESWMCCKWFFQDNNVWTWGWWGDSSCSPLLHQLENQGQWTRGGGDGWQWRDEWRWIFNAAVNKRCHRSPPHPPLDCWSFTCGAYFDSRGLQWDEVTGRSGRPREARRRDSLNQERTTHTNTRHGHRMHQPTPWQKYTCDSL